MNIKCVFKADCARWFKYNLLLYVIGIVVVNYLIICQNIEGIQYSNVIELIYLYMNDPFFVLNFIIVSTIMGCSYCDEKESGYFYYWINRCNERDYVFSKILNCFFSAFFVLFIGMMTWILSMKLFLPWSNTEADTYNILLEQGMGNLLIGEDYLQYCFLYCIGLGMLAGILSAGTFTVSLFLKNKTLVQIIAALLFYIDVAYLGDISELLYKWSFEQIFFFPASRLSSDHFTLFRAGIYSLVVCVILMIIAYKRMERLKRV